MWNGVFFDKKNSAEFDVECINGKCFYQILSGSDEDYTKRTAPKLLKAGESVLDEKYNTSTSGLGRINSALESKTILLLIQGTGSGITKVRCRLKATGES